MNETQVAVIGGGPAGLASAGELRRRGVDAVVLEQSDEVAPSWRTRYDRLRLNSSRPFSKLPGARYPRGTDIFPSRDDMVRYFEDYATRNRLEVWLGTRVERIDRHADSWLLRTSKGDVGADHVLVAGGHERQLFIPDWPGRERFQGRLIHSGEYRNPDSFQDDDVLVVGPGCSGMEIAYELATEGARRVRLAVRTPPNILIRSPIAPLLARMMMKLPPKRADRIMSWVRRRMLGDLTPYGLPIPEEGVFSRLRRLGVAPAIVDMHTIEAIKDGRIEITAGVESLDESGAILADGTRIEPDSVIAATGYRVGLEPLVGDLDVLDERGVPRVLEGEALPGLRFLGYRHVPAQIDYMGRLAKRTAKEIARAPAQSRWPRPLHEAGGDAAGDLVGSALDGDHGVHAEAGR
jgi:cation diffusion facilitator CzcD-associated flavoprotein CzcO